MLEKTHKKIWSKINDMSIKKKLLIAFSSILVVPIIIGFIAYNQSKIIIKDRVYMYNVDILNEVSKNIEYNINEIDKLSIVTMSVEELAISLKEINKGVYNEYSTIRMQDTIENTIWNAIILRDDILAAMIISQNNRIFSASKTIEPNLLITNEQKIYTEEANGSMVWLEPIKELSVIPVARAINDLKTQKQIGILVFYFKEEALRDIYENIRFYTSGDIYIISDNNMIISHKDQSKVNTISPVKFNNKEFGFFYDEIDGKESYITNYKMETNGWNLVSIIPVIEYEKEIVLLRNKIFLFVTICSVFVAAFSLYFSSIFSKPIFV